MKFENTNVYNMLEAVRAMRLSYGSESDSFPLHGPVKLDDDWLRPVIGPKDRELVSKLVANGPSHRKFMRQILLSVDITAPRYWWTQFDTYKVGVTACSESTMHTIMKREIRQGDFAAGIPPEILDALNLYRKSGFFELLVNALPQGYMQKRHVTMNYEVVRNIREQREGHKLGEWREFIAWSDRLPRARLFFGGNG